MPGRADLDLYNLLLGFAWVREQAELVRATVDPGFLRRARRALLPVPLVDRPLQPPSDVFRRCGGGRSHRCSVSGSR